MAGANARAPQRPQFEKDYLENPNDPRIQGFDTSGQREALMRDYSRNQGDAMAQTLANSTMALGGSRSTGTSGQLADIASQTSYAKNKALSDLAMKEWQDRQGMMGAYNQAKEARNKLMAGQYEDEMGSFNSEREARQQNTAALMAILGSFAGGGMGAGAAAAKPKSVTRG